MDKDVVKIIDWHFNDKNKIEIDSIQEVSSKEWLSENKKGRATRHVISGEVEKSSSNNEGNGV